MGYGFSRRLRETPLYWVLLSCGALTLFLLCRGLPLPAHAAGAHSESVLPAAERAKIQTQKDTLIISWLDFYTLSMQIESLESHAEKASIWEEKAFKSMEIILHLPAENSFEMYPVAAAFFAKASAYADTLAEKEMLWKWVEALFSNNPSNSGIKIADSWLFWAEVLSEHALQVSGKEREDLLHSAEENLTMAEKLGSPYATYNQARLACYRDQKELCASLLKKVINSDVREELTPFFSIEPAFVPLRNALRAAQSSKRQKAP